MVTSESVTLCTVLVGLLMLTIMWGCRLLNTSLLRQASLLGCDAAMISLLVIRVRWYSMCLTKGLL